MIIDYMLAAIALIWLVAASITDIKKREVANWLNFSLLAIALGLRAIGAIAFKDWKYFVYCLLVLAVFYIIAEASYYTKIFAGGDAKLFIALGAVFATQPSFVENFAVFNVKFLFVVVLLFNILFFGSLYGICYSIVLAFKERKKFVNEFSKLFKQHKKEGFIFLTVLIGFIIVFLALNLPFFLICLLLFTLIYPFLWLFVKAVENVCMIKLMTARELTEGDWLVNAVRIGRKTIKPTADGLTLEEIRMIKKSGKKVLVKQGIPFVPVFLIATIACLLHTNVLGEIMSLFM